MCSVNIITMCNCIHQEKIGTSSHVQSGHKHLQQPPRLPDGVTRLSLHPATPLTSKTTARRAISSCFREIQVGPKEELRAFTKGL